VWPWLWAWLWAWLRLLSTKGSQIIVSAEIEGPQRPLALHPETISQRFHIIQAFHQTDFSRRTHGPLEAHTVWADSDNTIFLRHPVPRGVIASIKPIGQSIQDLGINLETLKNFSKILCHWGLTVDCRHHSRHERINGQLLFSS